jgi:hypothetical protein
MGECKGDGMLGTSGNGQFGGGIGGGRFASVMLDMLGILILPLSASLLGFIGGSGGGEEGVERRWIPPAGPIKLRRGVETTRMEEPTSKMAESLMSEFVGDTERAGVLSDGDASPETSRLDVLEPYIIGGDMARRFCAVNGVGSVTERCSMKSFILDMPIAGEACL